MGYFLFLPLIVLTLLRWRMPKLNPTVLIDIILCVTLATFSLDYAQYAIALPLFSAMFFGLYWAIFAILYLLLNFDPLLAVTLIFAALSGLFLGLWNREQQNQLVALDKSASRYYELEALQSELTAALSQVERMTVVAERTRISRDIHDNAGHEIIAAYMSLQTARTLLDDADPDALELFDAALERLKNGTGKIRDTVHNLSAVTALGVDALHDISRRFPNYDVDFKVYGDTTKVPAYIWNILEACLNECLTNVARHSKASYVKVDLDATPHLVRLCIENDGAVSPIDALGSGLRNMRHRVTAAGGNLSVDAGTVFRVVCVVPIGNSV